MIDDVITILLFFAAEIIYICLLCVDVRMIH